MRRAIKERIKNVPVVTKPEMQSDHRISQYPPVIRAVFIETLRRHGVASNVLLSKDASRPVVRVRREICQHLAGMDLTSGEIARYLSRDSSTVRYTIAKVNKKPVASYDPCAPDESGIWAI